MCVLVFFTLCTCVTDAEKMSEEEERRVADLHHCISLNNATLRHHHILPDYRPIDHFY
jgi:hypothetical protein